MAEVTRVDPLRMDMAQKWMPVPLWDEVAESTAGLAMRTLSLPAVHVVTGKLHMAERQMGLPRDLIGWPEVAQGERYAVRLGRDKALVVGMPELTAGWHAQGFGVSPSESAGVVFEIKGPLMPRWLALGSEFGLSRASRAATRQFGAFGTVMYRHGDPMTLRVHVSRPLATAFLTWLRQTMTHVEPTSEHDPGDPG